MTDDQDIEIGQRWWSVAQVASALNVTTRTITNWIVVGGLLPAHRFGGLWRIADSDLQAFLRRTRVSADRVRNGDDPGAFGVKLRETQHVETYDGARTEAGR